MCQQVLAGVACPQVYSFEPQEQNIESVGWLGSVASTPQPLYQYLVVRKTNYQAPNEAGWTLFWALVGKSARSLVEGECALVLNTVNLHKHLTSTASLTQSHTAKRLVPRSGSLAEEEPVEEIEKIDVL